MVNTSNSNKRILGVSAFLLLIGLVIGFMIKNKLESNHNKLNRLIEETLHKEFYAIETPVTQNDDQKMITSKIDKSTYEHMIYENDLQVILVSNPDFDKAACAVSLDVGYFDDPDNIPGLAHFLEHMLFLGSEKYPDEEHFMTMVNKHGGKTNAYTSCIQTCYYSSIHKDHLVNLVDALSEFFISPLLNEDGVSREISAVNSEYLNGLEDQDTLQWDTIKEFVKEGFCLKQFECGNEASLKIPGIHKEVTKFFKERYSSDKCVLVICGVEPIERLKEIASVFKAVEKKPDTKRRPKNQTTQLFKDEYLCKNIKARSLNDKNDVRIHFTVPFVKDEHITNPLGFIEHLITTGEKGSFLNRLKNKGLGHGIEFDSMKIDECILVFITIKLTNLKHKQMALQMFYEELTNVLPQKINETEYNRIKGMNQQALDYSPNGTAESIAKEIAEEAQDKPWNYALHGKKIYTKYNRDMIFEIIKSISDRNKWLVVDFTDKFSEEEEKMIQKDKLLHEIDLFIGNQSLELKKTEAIPTKTTDAIITLPKISLVLDDNFPYSQEFQDRKIFKEGNLHFVFDKEFESPVGCISAHFKYSTHENLNILKIFCKTLLNTFQEENYRYIETNNIKISFAEINGHVRFDFSGFNSILCETVVRFFESKKVNKNFVNSVVSKLKSSYTESITGKPYARAGDVFNKHIRGLKQTEELLTDLGKSNIVLPENNPLLKLPLTIVAVGNLELNKLLNMRRSLNTKLTTRVESFSTETDSITFKDNEVFSFKTYGEDNNLMVRIYEAPAELVPHFILFQKMLSEVFFNELRTKEQLGYAVSLQQTTIKSRYFIILLAQSTKDVGFLSKRFDQFINEVPEKLENISNKDFDEFKEGAILHLTEKMQSLKELCDHVNYVYTHQGFDFTREKNLSEKVKALTKEDFKKTMDFTKVSKMEIKTTRNNK